jgi:hypothetical protein
VNFDANATHCVLIYFVIHPYAMGPIFVIAIVCLFLVLILEPPRPPPVEIGDHDSAVEYVTCYITI